MVTNMMKTRFLVGATAVVGLGALPATAQHVHGVIQLGVVVEDNSVAVSLHAPLSDVVGFEHAPESDEQRAAIEKAANLLSSPDHMFALTEAANCKASDNSLDGPAYITGDSGGADEHSDDDHHDDDHHDDHGSHHHDDEHDHHDDHEHGDDDEEHADDEHSEVTANYAWSCDDASRLESLELQFTDGFANVETIEVQVLTSAGAQVFTAESGTTSISLGAP